MLPIPFSSHICWIKMDSCLWKCCRTCLSVQNLSPIFVNVEHHDKYSDIIFTATGVKVELNDALPQHMCSVCINFINDAVKFRKKCEEINMQLLSQLNNKEFAIKDDQELTFKTELEKPITIDISHLLDIDNDFRDYDDNITLDSLQFNSKIEYGDSNESTNPDDKKVLKIKTENKRCKKTENGVKLRRKLQTKKENGVKVKKSAKEKEEKTKEEIECEYCHKILTSRLSLRNHYKIHTGFDVVCEHCGKKFITRRLLLMHCRAKHGYEKTDKCSYCDYKASNAEQVKIHERLHTGERPYVCSHCGAGFHRKSSYLQHVAIHLPEKTVQCDQCTARFKSVTLMRIHKNRHRAPAYSFQCKVCDNKFARRRNVARHLQRVHGLAPDDLHIERRKIG